jgi:transcriptional regulator with XRE-family HTH domain
MTSKEKQLRKDGSSSYSTPTGTFTSLISRAGLWKRLKKGKETRSSFVESNLNRSIAYQVRAIRETKGWTQERFAKEMGIDRNNVCARLENPHYGSHTLTSLKKVAKAGDVGLVVWFVPFSRMVDWETGTPHWDEGLRPGFYEIPDFDRDQLCPDAESRAGLFEPPITQEGPGIPDALWKMLGNAANPIDEAGLGSERTRLPKIVQQRPMEMPNA